MDLTIDFSGIDEVIEAVKMLGSAERIAEANEVMGEGVRAWLMDWYKKKAESGHFENPSLPTHGAGRNKTGWANEVARNWFAEARGDGARVFLSGEGGGEAGHDVVGSLLLKIYGGEVSAKNAQALTIPLVPEAHGVRAGVYPSLTGRKLFVLRKGEGRSDSDEGCLVESDGRGGIRAVYKLKKSQTFAPWPEAFPDMEEVADVAMKEFVESFLADDGTGGGNDWVD